MGRERDNLGEIKKKKEYAERREAAEYVRKPIPRIGGYLHENTPWKRESPEKSITLNLAEADYRMGKHNYFGAANSINNAVKLLGINYDNNSGIDTQKFWSAVGKRVDRLSKKVLAASKPDSGLLRRVEEMKEKVDRKILPYYDSESLVTKVSAFIFLLSGFFFMALPEFTATGNVIGNSAEANISFFLSLALMIIGGVLLFRSFKK